MGKVEIEVYEGILGEVVQRRDHHGDFQASTISMNNAGVAMKKNLRRYVCWKETFRTDKCECNVSLTFLHSCDEVRKAALRSPPKRITLLIIVL